MLVFGLSLDWIGFYRMLVFGFSLDRIGSFSGLVFGFSRVWIGFFIGRVTYISTSGRIKRNRQAGIFQKCSYLFHFQLLAAFAVKNTKIQGRHFDDYIVIQMVFIRLYLFQEGGRFIRVTPAHPAHSQVKFGFVLIIIAA